MDGEPARSDSAAGVITIIGLGPGDLDRIPSPNRQLLLDESRALIVRTEDHPAAAELALQRRVLFCDDLYDAHETFDAVYEAIAGRVLEAATRGAVVYAVPGSPLVGEFAVQKILDSEHQIELVAGESFVDAILAEVGYDPLDRGLQILNGHDLPDPLVLDKPTSISSADRPEVLADVCALIDRVVSEETVVAVMRDVGTEDQVILEARPAEVDPVLAGPRTSLFVDPEPGGLIGAVHTMRILREECPWDREQTHASLIKNLVE